MYIRLQNMTASYTGKMEIYLLDPSTAETYAILPTYSETVDPSGAETDQVEWTRSSNGTDVVDFFAATNDGSGPANITQHTPTGSSTIYVRLLDDGNGGYLIHFFGG